MPSTTVRSCVVCGAPVAAGWIGDVGTMMCSAHDIGPCGCCGRPAVTDGRGPGVVFDDGRVLCAACAVTVVVTAGQARIPVRRVERILRERVGLSLPEPLRVRLVTAEAIDALGGEGANVPTVAGERPMGLTRRAVTVLPDGTSTTQVLDVAILWGLPELFFERVLAHELGHAWMTAKGFPDDLAPRLVEGIAEAIAHLYLDAVDSDEGRLLQAAMAARDDDYGEGFRAVQAAFGRHGAIRTLRHVKAHRRLPA